jgi:hypothetical protein
VADDRPRHLRHEPHTVVELAELVADLLGLSFVERDSCYRGVYFLAEAAPYRIEVLVRVGVI